jgi:hypothetical protein
MSNSCTFFAAKFYSAQSPRVSADARAGRRGEGFLNRSTGSLLALKRSDCIGSGGYQNFLQSERSTERPNIPRHFETVSDLPRRIGQALYYRARIREKFAVNRVRIFIVAPEINPELRAAATEVSDTRLFEYALSMKVSVVASS